jgi:hypothetical protein
VGLLRDKVCEKRKLESRISYKNKLNRLSAFYFPHFLRKKSEVLSVQNLLPLNMCARTPKEKIKVSYIGWNHKYVLTFSIT